MPINMCAVELKDETNSRNILHLKRFDHCVVRFHAQVNNKAIQCKKCQRIGHTQANCYLEPRCVRCPGKHHYSECKISKSSPPVCCNCQGQHTANYRGCPAFKETAKRGNFHSHSQRVKTIPNPWATGTRLESSNTRKEKRDEARPLNRTEFPCLPQRSRIPNFSETVNSNANITKTKLQK